MSFLNNIFRRGTLEKFHQICSSRTTSPACGATDAGKLRNSNEDCYLLMPELGIYIVADGMGGHNAGEVASLNTVKTISDYFTSELVSEMKNNEEKIEEKLKSAIIEAHKRVMKISRTNEKYTGMGSTIAISFIHKSILHTCNVGDSRVYVINPSGITQITRDHSTVAEMVRMGRMTKEEARHSPLKNRITQAIGGPFPINPEYNQTYTLNKGDIVLICSDGLWEMLSDGEIQKIVLKGGVTKKTCEKLIQIANDAGGNDNITLVLVEIGQE